MTLFVLDEAALEIRAAHEHFDSHSTSLGCRFVDELSDAFEQIVS